MNMVQQFLSSPIINEEGSQQDTFKERSTLMVHIIRKMQYDMHLATSSKMKVITLSHRFVCFIFAFFIFYFFISR